MKNKFVVSSINAITPSVDYRTHATFEDAMQNLEKLIDEQDMMFDRISEKEFIEHGQQPLCVAHTRNYHMQYWIARLS